MSTAIDRLVQAIVDGTPARALREKLEALEARRAELEASADDEKASQPPLHPAMADLYRRKVSDLSAALTAPETRAEAAEILRGLIERIELRPSAEAYDILVRGDLAGILTLASRSKKPAALSRDGLSQVALVAGGRIWPLPNQWELADSLPKRSELGDRADHVGAPLCAAVGLTRRRGRRHKSTVMNLLGRLGATGDVINRTQARSVLYSGKTAEGCEAVFQTRRRDGLVRRILYGQKGCS